MIKLLKEDLKKRILLLDGGLGTMIQNYHFKESDFRGREFLKHPIGLTGCNDILNLTKPESIKEIHRKYLNAGADIITTNTFNANNISMKDYGLDTINGLVARINRAGAKLAVEAVEEYLQQHPGRKRFVAGSVGPTNRSASLSPEISNPVLRNVTYEELYKAYSEQIEGLLKGGVDILLFETFYDVLNLKAALDAAENMMKSERISVPLMVSASVSDKSGHLLSGQSLEAFIITIDQYENVLSIGLNCGFGPEEMSPLLEIISKTGSHYISCHPNAGLPDEEGNYLYDPDNFKNGIKGILSTGKINIIGGCCGTSPEHIATIKNILKEYLPFKPIDNDKSFRLAGNESLIREPEDFIIVGERCNVAGSRKFLRLIRENNLEEATEIAWKQVKDGAKILDINMDDPLLESKDEMIKFLRYILAEPNIARLPVMVDSSDWGVIEGALKNVPGKGVVNSLSLKDGENIFIERAKRIKELGFALIVMSFDEKGPGDTFERKIEICQRAYDLLTLKCGFQSNDIIFDVGVMAIATGMPEHSEYALNFIRAVEWIKKNLPGALTSGGVSNLSFSFRGKNKIREALHAVFLYHAKKAGLDMAIVNPGSLLEISEIDPYLRKLCEDLILNRDSESEAKLFDLIVEEKPVIKMGNDKSVTTKSVEERLCGAMISGELKNIDADIQEALEKYPDPISIIEGPLMKGMKTVGDLFGEGKMFLPQVIKTARVMSHAVDILKPHLPKIDDTKGNRGKILIATVKGDVHDIGKNIVGTVLGCNNFEILDLGVMVSPEKIVEAAKGEKPDIICLSGLITPSLVEMRKVVEMLEENQIEIPVMVGGAATSKLHTALKIAPSYSGVVMHMEDASKNPVVASQLMNVNQRDKIIFEFKKDYENLRAVHNKKVNDLEKLEIIEKLIQYKKRNVEKSNLPKLGINKTKIINFKGEDIIPFINWKMFFHTWKLTDPYLSDFPYSLQSEDIKAWQANLDPVKREKASEALELYSLALKELTNTISEQGFDAKGAIVFKEINSDNKTIYVDEITLPMLRQQKKGSKYLSCVDFVKEKDYIGFFIVTAGKIWFRKADEYERLGDNLRALILRTLADRFVEAASEWLHSQVRKKYWGYVPEENLTVKETLEGKYLGIRPAWGYPMLPDQKLILETQKFLPYKEIGVTLTENGAMSPAASISGLYFSSEQSEYFIIGEIASDQLKDYSNRRNMDSGLMKDLLRQT